MSFASLLRHKVNVVRQSATDDGHGSPELDDYGHQVITRETIATVRCRIEPRAVVATRERGLPSEAGVAISSHTIYMFPTDIRAGDRLVAQDGKVYEVKGVPDDAGGAGHHWEIAATLVNNPDLALAP